MLMGMVFACQLGNDHILKVPLFAHLFERIDCFANGMNSHAI